MKIEISSNNENDIKIISITIYINVIIKRIKNAIDIKNEENIDQINKGITILDNKYSELIEELCQLIYPKSLKIDGEYQNFLDYIDNPKNLKIEVI